MGDRKAPTPPPTDQVKPDPPPAPPPREILPPFVVDAREAYALFEGMRTEELLDLQAAHRVDQELATKPESIAFGAGRLALIADVLEKRGIRPDRATVASITCPICTRVSYNPYDIREKYCGYCHRFHDDPAPEASR